MQPIQNLRHGLGDIPGCLTEFPPDPAHRGEEPGVPVSSIWPEGTVEDQLGIDDPTQGLSELDDEDMETESDNSEAGRIPEFDPVIEIGSEIDDKIAALGGSAGEEIRQSVLINGMDALGWYSSFHVTGTQWGAYVSTAGIAYLIRHAFGSLNATSSTKAALAIHAILSHELFHFATDYGIAQTELMLQEPWWLPAKLAIRSGVPNYSLVEEKLANAYMLKAFRSMKPALRLRGKQEALRRFTLLQPPGYRDGARISSRSWDAQLNGLAKSYGMHSARGKQHPAIWSPSVGYDWPAQFPIRPRIDWRYCPIHLVDDSTRLGFPPGWLNILSRLQGIRETPSFLTKLSKMDHSIQRAWERTKHKLQTHFSPGLDLKKWSKGGPSVYSVRVNDNVRAHLKGEPSLNIWEAIGIGNHKEMGHG